MQLQCLILHKHFEQAASAQVSKFQGFNVSKFFRLVLDVSSKWGFSCTGTQARAFLLMVKYGISPEAVLKADLLNGAKLLGWEKEIGSLEPGYFADLIAVPGIRCRMCLPSKTSAS
jgi:adenine deaminase